MTKIVAARMVGARGRWATRPVAIQKVLKNRCRKEVILSNVSPKDIKVKEQDGQSILTLNSAVLENA